MYSEQQFYRNRRARWLQGTCAVLAIIQAGALAGAETGRLRLPFGYTAHWCILLAAVLLFGLLSQMGLTLRIDTTGLALRFFPYQWRFQRIGWSQIVQIRLLRSGEYPPKAQFGRPTRDFSQSFLAHLSGPPGAVRNAVTRQSTLYLYGAPTGGARLFATWLGATERKSAQRAAVRWSSKAPLFSLRVRQYFCASRITKAQQPIS